MVSEGKLTYQDIMIFDESRNYNVPVYSFSPYSNIIVACEKDTIYSIVEDISRLLGCSCISSKGLCSLGAMEQLIRKIQLSKDEPLTEMLFCQVLFPAKKRRNSHFFSKGFSLPSAGIMHPCA